MLINCRQSADSSGSDTFTKERHRDFPGGLVAKTPPSQCRGLGFIPAQGTRSHMLQLRPGAAKYIF